MIKLETALLVVESTCHDHLVHRIGEKTDLRDVVHNSLLREPRDLVQAALLLAEAYKLFSWLDQADPLHSLLIKVVQT